MSATYSIQYATASHFSHWISGMNEISLWMENSNCDDQSTFCINALLGICLLHLLVCHFWDIVIVGHNVEGRNIVCLGLRVLSERCRATVNMWGHHQHIDPVIYTPDPTGPQVLPPSFTSGGSGRQQEAGACCMHCVLPWHESNNVLCVRWQPGIFPKLLHPGQKN